MISTNRTNQVTNEGAKTLQANENLYSILFPYAKDEFFPKEKKTHVIGSGLESIVNGKKIEKVILHKTVYSNYNKTYKKYESEIKKESNQIATVRCSSAYMSDAEMKNKEFLESKTKWISNYDFRRTFGKRTEMMNDKPLVEYKNAPYTSPGKFTFRDANKTKWVNKKNFQLA